MGSLRQLLAGAPQLEHFSFSCSTEPGHDQPAVPVQEIFPVTSWPNLRHFGIHQLTVLQSGLVSLLLALPVSLRSVKLSQLAFKEGSSYHTLLCDMRDTLGWRNRAPDQRPHVRLIFHVKPMEVMEFPDPTDDPADYLLVDEPANMYLYSSTETNGSPNPFSEDWPNFPIAGLGIVGRSYADPSFEKQW